MKPDYYDESYYRHGIETGKSNYQNYRWLPEFTMGLAMTLIDHLSITRQDKILDFGCAFGFLVKAFRLLHRQAWGTDISEYALENIDPDVRKYCFHVATPMGLKFDWCIMKDVLEHIEEGKLYSLLKDFPAKRIFASVPLGKDGIYFAPANNLDKSHVICEDLYWWSNCFGRAGYKICSFGYKIEGIKDAYYSHYPEGHGFFILEK